MLSISSILNMLNFNLQYHPLLEEVSPRFLISKDFLQWFSDSAIFFTLQRENLLDSLNSSPTNINPVLDMTLNVSFPSMSFLQNEELNNKRFIEPLDMYNWYARDGALINDPWDIYISADLVNHTYPIYSTTWVSFNQRPAVCMSWCPTHYLVRSPNLRSMLWKVLVPRNPYMIHLQVGSGGINYITGLDLNNPLRKL